MSIEKLRPSFTFTEDRLRELQQVVPEAFADGKINWVTLREALGEHLEDEGQAHFASVKHPDWQPCQAKEP